MNIDISTTIPSLYYTLNIPIIHYKHSVYENLSTGNGATCINQLLWCPYCITPIKTCFIRGIWHEFFVIVFQVLLLFIFCKVRYLNNRILMVSANQFSQNNTNLSKLSLQIKTLFFYINEPTKKKDYRVNPTNKNKLFQKLMYSSWKLF